MIRNILFGAATLGLCIGPVSVGHAASKDDQKMMRLLAECVYVVRVAEGNGVKLNNPSSTWDQAMATISVKFGLDPSSYEAEARAKYKRRERVMGSGEALQKVIKIARDCDAQL